MALNPRLESWLARRNGACEVFPHRETFDLVEVGRLLGLPPQEIARVEILRDFRGEHFMIVVPASRSFDACIVRTVTGHAGIVLESREVRTRLAPDCAPDTVPPFGHLYGLATFIDPCLLANRHIGFRAGNLRELVRMPVGEFSRLAQPFESTSCLHRAESERTNLAVRV